MDRLLHNGLVSKYIYECACACVCMHVLFVPVSACVKRVCVWVQYTSLFFWKWPDVTQNHPLWNMEVPVDSLSQTHTLKLDEQHVNTHTESLRSLNRTASINCVVHLGTAEKQWNSFGLWVLFFFFFLNVCIETVTRTTLSRTDMISQMEGLSFYGLFPVCWLCAEDNRLLISSDFNQVWDAHHMSHTSISQDLCMRVVLLCLLLHREITNCYNQW